MIYAVIVAGGAGNRMKSSIPKQFLLLNEKPILHHTIKAFQQNMNDLKIILVLPQEFLTHQEYINSLADDYSNIKLVAGGNTRFQSVKNGLDTINTEDGIVFIHDGVRPFINKKLLDNCLFQAQEKGNAIPCVLIKDSLRIANQSGNEYVNRENFRAIQTPQTFKISLIKKAFEQDYNESFTDEATVLETIGEKINLIEGMDENIKITTPFDLQLAAIIIKSI